MVLEKAEKDMRRLLVLVRAVVLVLAAACGMSTDDDERASSGPDGAIGDPATTITTSGSAATTTAPRSSYLPPRPDPTTASTTTTAPPAPGPALEWRTRRAVAAGGGWETRACEGDAPFYCAYERDVLVGVVELASFPLPSFESLRGLPRSEALDRLAADGERSIREDRETGCPPGSRYASIPARRLPVAGDQGIRYGFTVTSPRGAAAERSVTYATIVGDTVFLTVAAAFGEGSCVAAEGTQFQPATLERFEPVLDRLVARMLLP